MLCFSSRISSRHNKRLKYDLRPAVVPPFLEPHMQRSISLFISGRDMLENFSNSLSLPLCATFHSIAPDT
jgi:hypothetical protein